MANMQVHVVRRDGVWKAIPPHVSLTKTDTITWYADESDVVIFEPNQLFFNGTTKAIKKGKKSGPHTVQHGVRPGVYDYAIHCKGPSLAVGASHPRIIIDR